MPDLLHLSQSDVRTMVHYDPETGIVMRLVDGGRAAKAGDVVGYEAAGGLEARIGGKRVRVHRLIWFYMTGCWPDGVVDHKDRNFRNNRWLNLRVGTQAQNRCNSSKPRHNTSGVVGVVRCRDKWRAQITVKNRCVHIGVFDTPEQAAEARRFRAKELWGEFAPEGV
jgi:hypothetical protein